MITCAICGRSSVKISKQKGICKECFIKTGLVKEVKKIKITLCPSCYRIRRERWITYERFSEIEHMLERILERKIILNEGVSLEDIEVKASSSLDTLEAELYLFLKDYDEYVETSIKPEIELNRVLCDDCLRYKSEDYEALLQIRSEDENLVEEFELFLEKLLQGLDREVVKKEKFNYGLDVYFSKLSTARRLANSFKKKHPCRYKETQTLKSRARVRYTLLLDFNS